MNTIYVLLLNQNVQKRIISGGGASATNNHIGQDNINKHDAGKQQQQHVAEFEESLAQNLNRNAAAAVAARSLGRTSFTAGGGGGGDGKMVMMLNEDTGESYLRGFGVDGNMLRGGAGHRDNSRAAVTTTTTTEKYPMQWGYQVLPTLYSLQQKVLWQHLTSYGMPCFLFGHFPQCFCVSINFGVSIKNN